MNSILSNFIMDVYSEVLQHRQGDWKTCFNVLAFFFPCAKLMVKAFEGMLHLGFLIIKKYSTNWSWGLSAVALQREILILDQWLAEVHTKGALRCNAAFHPRLAALYWGLEGKHVVWGGMLARRFPSWGFF